MPIRPLVRKAEHFLVHNVLSLDDTPHRIALGVAIAVWLAWTPTIGLQTVLVLAACTALGANKAVGLPFVWISNPATLVPIFYPNYRVGCFFLHRPPTEGMDALRGALALSDGGWLEHISAWQHAISPIVLELWLGSALVATPLGLVTYFVVKRMVVVYRHTYQDWKDRRARR